MQVFWGVRAKIDRAGDQLRALNTEVQGLRENPMPFAILVERDQRARRHIFRLYPRWKPDTVGCWAVVVGEIVHDLRSALDHLVREVVHLSGGEPDSEHAFPICRAEPCQGFQPWATRTWRKSRHKRHGKLYGVSDAAISLIEGSQPYKGGHGPKLLALIDSLWQFDKHRMLLPIVLPSVEPSLEFTECKEVKRLDWMEEGAYVVEVWVSNIGPNPNVDVKGDAPFDIALGERAVIDDLIDAAKFILLALCGPLEELFPDAEDLETNRRLGALQEWLEKP